VPARIVLGLAIAMLLNNEIKGLEWYCAGSA